MTDRNTPPSPNGSAPDAPPAPWWREPMVWLVIAGPAVVVVAGVLTVVLAVQRPDPLVANDRYRRVEARQASQSPAALRPAMQARNHAASPQPRESGKAH